MTTINQKSQKCYHSSNGYVKDRDFLQKTKHHKVWVNLQFEHVVGHLQWQSLPKIKKISQNGSTV